jgi:hypothetical protein
MNIFEKEADLAFLECNHYVDTLTDAATIDLYTESGDDSSFFTKLKNKMKDLVQKVKEFILNLFGEKSERQKEIDRMNEELSAKHLENTKMKVLDSKKLYALSKTFVAKIKNAKSEEEINKIVKEYDVKKTRCFVFAAAGAVIGFGVYEIKAADNLEHDYNVACDELEKAKGPYEATISKLDKEYDATSEKLRKKFKDSSDPFSYVGDVNREFSNYMDKRKKADSAYLDKMGKPAEIAGSRAGKYRTGLKSFAIGGLILLKSKTISRITSDALSTLKAGAADRKSGLKKLASS